MSGCWARDARDEVTMLHEGTKLYECKEVTWRRMVMVRISRDSRVVEDEQDKTRQVEQVES